MPIVPHVSPACWRSRIYPGNLAQMRTVRADLRADLAGYDKDLIETVTLCASEMVANAVEHTRSGEKGGRVVRALFRSGPEMLRLVVVDDGAQETSPTIPRQRTEEEWACAERGRGLLMVDASASTWGTYPVVPFPFCAELGTAVWAEFGLGGGGL